MLLSNGITCMSGIPEEEERDGGTVEILVEIMAEKDSSK